MQIHRDEPEKKSAKRTTDWPVVVFLLGVLAFVILMVKL